jgi:hypothetical protein
MPIPFLDYPHHGYRLAHLADRLTNPSLLPYRPCLVQSSLRQKVRMAPLGRERDQLLRLLLNSRHIAHVLVKSGSFSHRIGNAFRMAKYLRLGERFSNKR